MQQVMDQEDRGMLLDERLSASLEPAGVLLRATETQYTDLAAFHGMSLKSTVANPP